MITQSLNDIIQVIVNVTPTSTLRSNFNLGLIIGKSTKITTADRVKVFSDLPSMISAGFANNDPEYLAAQVYFSQIPRPRQVAIGCWDSPTETALQAVQACRSKNNDWYACYVIDAVKQDIIDVAAFIESATPVSAHFYQTSDADILTNTPGNIFLTLQGTKTHRSIGQYSTIEYAAAAIMGYAMGANTGLANSAYTLAYKPEVGITAEALTSAQVTSIKASNGNAYVNRGYFYNTFEQGVMADGTPFDQVLNLDVLVNAVQIAIMDLLTSATKIPQTEDGVGMIINAITGPCSDAKTKGFIAPGVWNAAPILNVNTGDTLSNGYLILADKIANQLPADRTARKSPPIYVLAKLAGAIEFVVINIIVNQ